ncbi:MAG: hypothetical protein RBT74_17430 [Tenuifilaceae bacterium]|nr:hypothetical protein [Tenuifilaceae bacterium]
MRIKIIYTGAIVLLLASLCVLPEAKSQSTTPLQANLQEALLHQDEGAKGDYWLLLPDKSGIYYNEGRVGIGTANPSLKFMLHVKGAVGVNELMIGSEYALPAKRGTADQFLNGLGEWATPAGGGGDNYWQAGSLNNAIYYNRGWVGIGTDTPAASLHVQGNMKMGSNIGAVGTNAFAGGDGSTASGTNAFAFGDEAKALNTGAFASGLRAEASGTNSTALGRASKAANENTIALGYVTEALTPNAVVIGKHARVVAGNSYIIGSGLGLGSDMLENDVGYSIMIGMKSNVPTFFVGPSDGAGTTGSIGIGNMTDPQAKLHIYSDENKAATLKLEHRTTGKDRYAEIGLGTHSIRAGNTENMVFKTPSSRHFVFENGNVGIGVSTPETEMHIRGDITVSGLADDKGDQIVASDRDGKLILIPSNSIGDNLGNHIATSNLVMGTHSIRNDMGGYQLRDDRTRFSAGLVFDLDNSMVLETGKKAVFTAVAASNSISGLWATNWSSGGYGLVLNADNRTGGIYYDNNNPKVSIGLNSNKVGIGLIPPSEGEFSLYVEGGILAEEVKVLMKSAWPDYVFNANYKLPSINEVSEFIEANGHLPGIPNAATVATDGIELGEMNALLLTKIEELTLYVIELQQQLNELKK